MDLASVNEELAEIDGQIGDILRVLQNGFQKLEKIKDANRRSRQLEELTDKMRDCKRLIKDFERVSKAEAEHTDPATAKMLHDRKQSMIKELNSYVALKKQQASENKRIDLFDGPSAEDGFGEENVLLASNMTNQQLMDQGNQLMDETDQAIARSKQTVQETVNVGTETAAALKAQVRFFSYFQKESIALLCCPIRKAKGNFGLFLLHQTEQMSRVVNELDSIHFSIKKASQLVKEIGRQVATDRCIMAMLFLIVAGVIAIIIVKIVNPHNKDIRDIPGLAPPVSRRLLR
ncbi:putative plant SNARE 11 [Zea mays]|nr:putative plant SNARE 11 [Zea mays]PWZ18690.1 putative plant SNARE 11 [Zea mays]